MIRSSIRVLTALVPAAVLACGEAVEINAIPTDEAFTATLSAANEVPPTTSPATGTAVFRIVQDTFLIWRVDIAGLDTPTAVHIHPGAAGATGGIMQSLGGSRQNRVGFTGQFGVGQIKRSTRLTDTLATFDQLIGLLRAGTAYVNVHSARHPGGAIRGQIQAQ